MKAIAACPACMQAQVTSGIQPTFKPISGELDDLGYIHVNCDLGHHSIVIYDARRYEVLMQSAAQAFVDGYTNEVVAVMAAALERAYEFYIRVSCRAKRISPDNIDAAWKTVASQSERQFGAFQFLYLIDHGKAFKLDKTITEVRNSIIHKGRIAREKEALNFSENIFKHIRMIEDSIHSKFSQYASEQGTHEIEIQKALVPEGVASIILKNQTVRFDPSKGKVIGIAASFSDLTNAVLQRRSRGFPN